MKTNEASANKKKEAFLQLVTVDDLELFKFELLTEIQKLLSGISTNKPAKKWLKSEEVKALLGASTSKLATLRINGILPYDWCFSVFGHFGFFEQHQQRKLFIYFHNTFF